MDHSLTQKTIDKHVKRDLQIRKETFERDLQKRPFTETYKYTKEKEKKRDMPTYLIVITGLLLFKHDL